MYVSIYGSMYIYIHIYIREDDDDENRHYCGGGEGDQSLFGEIYHTIQFLR